MTKKRRLRIASYNINGVNSRLHVLTRWLEEFQPDIVGLQELKCTDEQFPNQGVCQSRKTAKNDIRRCSVGAFCDQDLAKSATTELGTFATRAALMPTDWKKGVSG
jgi:exonuclease III